MRRKKPIIILCQILKSTAIHIVFLGYVLTFFIIAAIIMRADPDINSYGNALWYCFVSCTTIGFGDIVATTVVSRVFTVVLYLYTIVVVALFTSIMTKFIFEMVKAKNNEAITLFMDDMEHLEYLPTERLAEMSAAVRKNRKK